MPVVVAATLAALATPTPALQGETQPACVVSAADLRNWRSKPELLIVDTRAAAEFRDVRIPGSVNFPAYALRSKAFLQDRPLLLVDSSPTGRDLVERCRALREAGFSEVGVLAGGLRSWARHAREARDAGGLIGDARAERALAMISPSVLLRGSGAQPWLVVDVSARSNPVERELAGMMIRIPLCNEATFRAAVERATRKRSRSGPTPFVLLADASGERSARLQRIADALAVEHAYVLDGGFEGYRRCRAKQERILASAARGCTLGRCGGK